MIRRLPYSIFAGHVSDVNSLLVSAVCHLMLLVMMGLWVAAGHSSSPGLQLAADIEDASELPSHDDSLLADTVQVAADKEDAAALGPVRLFDDTAVVAGDLGPIDAVADMASASGLEGHALGDFGNGSGGEGASGKSATKFFGVEGYGKRFVYVVDCSGSMSENGKFQRAIYELLQSIEQLRDDQQYFVIFYNHRAYPMEEKGLVRATPEQFEKTRKWVSFARPQGGTVPQPALLQALSMKPDAIFFLSDGLFDPDTARVVRMANRGKSRHIPIHTIAFVNRENESLMYMIARNSDGKYRYVP